jgi:hypothetical protein
MSVKIARANPILRVFGSLKWGDTFFDSSHESWTHVGNNLYMKIPPSVGQGDIPEKRWNAVCLNDGTVEWFRDEHEVDEVQATILFE